MAQFRATIQGQRGEASRLGTKKSGMSVTVNGWQRGIRVEANYREDLGADCFTVFATHGSSPAEQEIIALEIIGDRIYVYDLDHVDAEVLSVTG